MSDPIITFDHVVKEFKTRGRGANIARAVDDVSLTIDRGDIFGIIGYSGAGKSTLVRLINALERPTSGTVTVLGTDITSLSETKLRPIRQKIGMIFQQFNLFSTKTVAQNIAYPGRIYAAGIGPTGYYEDEGGRHSQCGKHAARHGWGSVRRDIPRCGSLAHGCCLRSVCSHSYR